MHEALCDILVKYGLIDSLEDNKTFTREENETPAEFEFRFGNSEDDKE